MEISVSNGHRPHFHTFTRHATASLRGPVSTYCLGWTRPIHCASSTTQCLTAAIVGSMLPFRSQDGAGPATARSPGVCISTPSPGTPCRGTWHSIPRASRSSLGSAVWESIPFEPSADPLGSYPWRRRNCREDNPWRGRCSRIRSCHRRTTCWRVDGNGCHESPRECKREEGRWLLLYAPQSRSRASPSST